MTDADGYAALPVGAFLDALAAGVPAPAAGSAAALAVAQAAALCAKVARKSGRQLTVARSDEITAKAEGLRAAVVPLIDADPRAYRAVILARRAVAATTEPSSPAGTSQTSEAARPGPGKPAGTSRTREAARPGPGKPAGTQVTTAESLTEALSRAADVPMRIAEHAAAVAELAASLAADGNPALRGDAVTAALMAEAGARSAAVLVEINLADSPADPRQATARTLIARITALVRTLERAVGGT